ncbi:MAG TPA: T9SS type A sorting domain-containing protein [Bacteroidia bacterium]|jgi:sugar lactone lactonase YvrE|nr:T9SS type A sorting domain-containing protein [Bacteroidia bacterium]
MEKLLFIFVGSIIFTTINAQNYHVSTVVGNGTGGLLDSIGTNAICYSPYSVKSDGANTIYFADTYNHAIRKFDITTLKVTTIAGNGVAGYQDGSCATAKFNYPEGVFYKNGNLYVGDNINNVIRKIDLTNNIVSTVAGSGSQGYQDGAANQAKFYQPKYLIVDNSNNVFVADYENHCIRKITSSGQVSTIAGVGGVSGYVNGAGSSAKFYRPADLCMDASGNIYVTDIMNFVIRKIDVNLNVTTFAGNHTAGNVNGTAGNAEFTNPTAIDITNDKHFYVADGLGGDNIRKIDSLGNVTTVAGVFNNPGYLDGAPSIALFNQIQGLCFDPHGNLYIGDAYNNRIRKISVPECSDCAGIEQISAKNQIVIYPNPSSNTVTIEVLNATENCTYKTYNTLGQEVKSGNLTQTTNQINVQELSNGVYSIVVSQKDKTSIAKIIVQK